MELDFSNLNFVNTCESITTATSTITYCHSSAETFVLILSGTILFFLGVFILYKMFK